MKRILRNASTIFALSLTSAVFANTGSFFNVAATGSTLTINTTIPGHTYPAAGIKLNSAGYSIVSGCTPYSNGYCLFSVSDTTPASIVVSGPTPNSLKANLCLNGKGPLTCQNKTISIGGGGTTRIAYVSNFLGGTVSLCTVDATTGALSGCVDSGAGSFDQPAGMTLNAAQTRAYVIATGVTDSVSLCTINPTTFALSCADSGADNLFNPGGIVLNEAESVAYITNSASNGNNVIRCTINSNGTLTPCVDSGVGAIFSAPFGIALNSAGTRAYVANAGSDIVSLCIIGSGGAFTGCSNSSSGTSFSTPIDITLNAAGTRAYVTNRSGSGPTSFVFLCTVDGTTGLLSGCGDAGGTGFDNATRFAFNADESRAYVTNFSGDTVSVCDVNSSTGLLSGCSDTNSPVFSGPWGLSLI